MAVKAKNLKGSSLVETLVSMVIILIVFGIGLMIFVNITKASRSEIRKNTGELMAAWSHELEAATPDGNLTGEIQRDSMLLSYEMTEMQSYPDRIRLVIHAMQQGDKKIMDSLVRYIPNRAGKGGEQ